MFKILEPMILLSLTVVMGFIIVGLFLPILLVMDSLASEIGEPAPISLEFDHAP